MTNLTSILKEFRATFLQEKERVFLLFLAAITSLATFAIIANLIGESSYSLILINMCADFICAIILFILLEQGIRKIDKLRSGIQDFNELPIDDYIKDLNNAKYNILILDTYLYSLIEDKDNRPEKFRSALKNAIVKNNIDVKILILDPKSEAAQQRAEDLNQDSPDSVLSDMRKGLTFLKGLYHDIKADSNYTGNMPIIKVFDSAPPYSLYSIDDTAFWNFHPIKKKSTASPLLQIPLKLQLGLFLKNKFDEIWEDGETKRISDYSDSDWA